MPEGGRKNKMCTKEAFPGRGGGGSFDPAADTRWNTQRTGWPVNPTNFGRGWEVVV
jgi:hypothetical protein